MEWFSYYKEGPGYAEFDFPQWEVIRIQLTDDTQLSTEVVDEVMAAYGGCPHYYYWVGDDMQDLCLHGDDLAYDLGAYGGIGTFHASLGGACGIFCPGDDEVTLTWFVPPR